MIYRPRKTAPRHVLKWDRNGMERPWWLPEWVTCNFFKDKAGRLYAHAHGRREQTKKPKHEDRAREQGEDVISTWYEVSAA